MSNSPILPADQLDAEQHSAVTAPRGPVCIIAGAGTGKTRTITHRIEHLINGNFVNPSQILALSFTRRAAGELRERLRILGFPAVQAMTFHSAAARQLRAFWPEYAGNITYRQLTGAETYRVLSRALAHTKVTAERDTYRDILTEIEWAKSCLVVPERYPNIAGPARRDCPINPHDFSRVFRAYEEIKLNGSSGLGEDVLLDFSDILIHTAGAIESNPAIADIFRSRYRTFIVDEYQDTNPLQQRLLEAWIGPRDDITVVGDANQTIYSFTGATPEYLLGFTKKFPHAETVSLYKDYRSTPQVVNLANAVIAQSTGRTVSASVTLEGQRDDGPDPQFTEYSDSIAEAQGVVRQITHLLKQGIKPQDIAILSRTNEQSIPFTDELDRAGIGYLLRGGDSFFSRKEVLSGLASIKQAFVEFAPEPEHLVQAARNALKKVGLSDTPPEEATARRRHTSLSALLDLIQDIYTHAAGKITYIEMLKLLDDRQQSHNPPDFHGVTLSTIHAAKGLEWEAVFITGVEERSIPSHHALKGANSEEAIEEERRLLYVAITRAKEYLYLSWAQARSQGGQASRKRSRFLDGLVPWEKEAATGATSSARRSPQRQLSKKRDNVCSQCGERLSKAELRMLGLCQDHAPQLDRIVVQRLREWRLREAQRRSVPAYIVFNDATLAALAMYRPTTLKALLRVPGVGAMKAQEFGDAVLSIISDATSL